jgi:hypothetical protein
VNTATNTAMPQPQVMTIHPECPPSGLVRQIVGLEEGRISGSS